MVTAFVMIVSRPGEEKDLAEDLRSLPEVKEVWEVYGEYDLVLRMERLTTTMITVK
jgi:DNA-binding Lrp family transcriptional regulator